jgi:hypothetical protein
VPITADNLPDDLAALKRIIATMAQDVLTAQAEIARLKFQLGGPPVGSVRRAAAPKTLSTKRVRIS